ncbi:uncharacterized protein G2W53_027073 [Senna tora]|uniref:Uncharacterized protein n=1 Tax=Senna tora TaxID=362788 RepID=A0A834TGH0_9FABA|nr:uncharacterized protein G2W53_027073 [Senna tora]
MLTLAIPSQLLVNLFVPVLCKLAGMLVAGLLRAANGGRKEKSV